MKLVRLEVQGLWSTPSREQAMVAAKNRAKAKGIDVKVVAHMDDGQTREVVYHPDGSVDRLWEARK